MNTHPNRIRQLRNCLTGQKTDAFLVSNFYNIAYLTGFRTLAEHEHEAFVVVTEKNVYVISDGRYIQANRPASHPRGGRTVLLGGVNGKNILHVLQEITKEENIKTLAFEAEDIRFSEYRAFSKALSTVRLISAQHIIKQIRSQKEKEEIAHIERACAIGDECLQDIVRIIRKDTTEKEIAFKIEYWLKEKGYVSGFDPLVAIDEHASIPHYDTKNGNGSVKNRSVILIDFGVKYKGYSSDMTRMFFFGKTSDEMRNIYHALLDIQQKTLKKADATNNPKKLDAYCRSLYKKNNLPDFPHSLGHGVGLEIHELPRISQKTNGLLETNQVFTIEPGVYIPGKFGMRIEDTVWKQSEKKLKKLTKFAYISAI